MNQNIEGKVIVNTGASSGMGEAADVQQANKDDVGAVGHSPESFARVVAFAIIQPEDMDFNEIIFRPTAQKL